MFHSQFFYGFLVSSSFKSFTATRLGIFSEHPSNNSNRIYTIICCIPNLIDQWVWYRFLREVIMDIFYGGSMFYNRENKFLDVWKVAVHLIQFFLYSPENWTKMMSIQTWFFFFSLAQYAQSRSLYYALFLAFPCSDKIWDDNKEPITASNIFHL